MNISIVTMNRRDILAQVLASIDRTCAAEQPTVWVSDNGSTDGTGEMLAERAAHDSHLRYALMGSNLGAAKARNAHWKHCIGEDTVKLDDKVLFQASGWLTMLSRLSAANHAVVGIPYDPILDPVKRLAPLVGFLRLDGEAGVGGPLIYVPGEVSAALGYWDELTQADGTPVLHGWEDVLYIQRARLLGWPYALSSHTATTMLARASEAGRQRAAQNHPIYAERLREYRDAERDIYFEPEPPVVELVGHAELHLGQ